MRYRAFQLSFYAEPAKVAGAILLLASLTTPSHARWYKCKDCPDTGMGYADSFYNGGYVDATVVLPTIVITGTHFADGTPLFQLYQSPGAWTTLFAETTFVTSSNSMKSTEKLVGATDIRSLCGVPGRQQMASTVSTDDAVKRGDAVRAMVGLYAVRWSMTMVKARLTGELVNIGGKDYMSVEFTFADNGKERYYVNPLSTDNSTPAPSTLKVGDGVAKNVPCASPPPPATTPSYYPWYYYGKGVQP